VELLRPELARLEALAGKSDVEVTEPLDAFLEMAEASAITLSERIVDDPDGRHAVAFTNSDGRRCLMKTVEGAELKNKPRDDA
jgi:hypothetical protein